MLDQEYVLGHSATEVRRLEVQSRLLDPGTERTLLAAGLKPGMSVLDIGTGAGDVAMLAAAIVGEDGSVLGIDREATVLARASRRALDAGLRHLRFEASTLDALPEELTFDVVVGRYVLHHQADRVAFLRQAAKRLRSRGTLLFIEPDLPEAAPTRIPTGRRWSTPPAPLFDTACELCLTGLAQGGVRLSTGGELVRMFHEAGFPEPELLQDEPIGNSSSTIIEWVTLTLRTVLPLLEKQGVTTAADVDIDSLQARLQASVLEARSQIRLANLVGAWVTFGECRERLSR